MNLPNKMEEISIDDTDLEFLKKGLLLFQEEETVLKSQVERLEAEIDEIKRLILQRPESLQEDNELENEIHVDSDERQEENLKISPKEDLVFEINPIDIIQTSDSQDEETSDFKSVLDTDNEFLKNARCTSQQNLHESVERGVITKTNVLSNITFPAVYEWDLDDSKSDVDIDSIECQTESLKTTDTQKSSFPHKSSEKEMIYEANPLSNLSLSDSSNTEIGRSESTVGITALNFKNDFFENNNSISQQNSVSLTSSTKSRSRIPSQSELITYLPKCLQKNYFKRKRVKPKRRVKQKFEPLRKNTTRLSVKLSKISPAIPSFLVNKTLLNSEKESNQSSSDSEDETASLPDLEDSIFEEFSELNEDTSEKKKSTFKPFLTLPDSVPTIITKALQAPINDCKLDHIQKCIGELEDYICPDNTRNLIFYILRFLSVISENPINDYMNHPESSSLLIPVEDSCFAYLFINMDAHPKLQNTGFLLTVLMNMRLLILGMDAMTIDGLCGFCRVFTRICKLKKNEKEPISLCCDILKMTHKFTPMLVASIAAVWQELFDVSYDAPENVTTFYGSISLAARKWPKAVPSAVSKAGLTTKEWETSRLLVDHYISASPVHPSEDTIFYLFHNIEEKCIKESNEEGSMFINALLIFASYKTWSWVKDKIVDKYLTRKIRKCSYSARNVDCLTLYCKLYGEICSLNACPDFKPEKLLMKLFTAGSESTEYKFLQEASAVALLQLLLSTKKYLPDSLEEWIKENESNPKFLSIKLLQHRYRFRNKTDFTAEDMLC